MGPYRALAAAEVLDAPAREGAARLEVGPRHTVLEIAERVRVSVTELALEVSLLHGRKRKERTFPLGGRRLVVARAVPTDDIGLWCELRPGVVQRVFGVSPPDLLDDAALDAWRQLDRIGRRLREALEPLAGGAEDACEIGRGADRVLVIDHGDRLVVYVRRLFRERARRVLEVHGDGTVVVAGRRDSRIRCTSRYGVTVLGDRIRFADSLGTDLAALWVPWVSPEDRKLLARMFGDKLHHG